MAAGRGSRLGSATADRPKSLIDLGGITPLEWQIDELARRSVERLMIVTGYQRELVEAAARQRAPAGMEVVSVWNPFWPVTNVLGSAWLARGHLRSAFLYLHADTLFDPRILDDLFASEADVALPIDYRACEPEQMKAAVTADRVVRLSKELADDAAAGEFIGLALFRAAAVPVILRGMDAVIGAPNLGAYFEEAINWAIAHEGLYVAAVPTRGRAWTEIDFPDDLELARRILPGIR